MYLSDAHVIKMILESAQMLSTAACEKYEEANNIKLGKDGAISHAQLNLYKPTHVNRPCSKWVRQNPANFMWLASHAIHLCHLYFRNKNSVMHKSENVIVKALSMVLPGNVTNIEQLVSANFNDATALHRRFETIGLDSRQIDMPARAMPDEYKTPDPVESYRGYYACDKIYRKDGKLMMKYGNMTNRKQCLATHNIPMNVYDSSGIIFDDDVWERFPNANLIPMFVYYEWAIRGMLKDEAQTRARKFLPRLFDIVYINTHTSSWFAVEGNIQKILKPEYIK